MLLARNNFIQDINRKIPNLYKQSESLEISSKIKKYSYHISHHVSFQTKPTRFNGKIKEKLDNLYNLLFYTI